MACSTGILSARSGLFLEKSRAVFHYWIHIHAAIFPDGRPPAADDDEAETAAGEAVVGNREPASCQATRRVFARTATFLGSVSTRRPSTSSALRAS